MNDLAVMIPKPSYSKSSLIPGRNDSCFFPLFAYQRQMSDSPALIFRADQESTNSMKVIKSRGPQIDCIREEADGPGIALHHALVHDHWKRKIFTPDAHGHHEVEVSGLSISAAGLPNSVVGHSIGQAAITNLAHKPVQVQDSEARSNQRLVDQVVPTLESGGACCEARDIERVLCLKPNLFAGNNRCQWDRDVVDPVRWLIGHIAPYLAV